MDTGHLLQFLLCAFFFLFQNLSQQSDVADLLGGFKPMDAQFVCFPLYKEFENLFSKTFSVKVMFESSSTCILFIVSELLD